MILHYRYQWHWSWSLSFPQDQHRTKWRHSELVVSVVGSSFWWRILCSLHKLPSKGLLGHRPLLAAVNRNTSVLLKKGKCIKQQTNVTIIKTRLHLYFTLCTVYFQLLVLTINYKTRNKLFRCQCTNRILKDIRILVKFIHKDKSTNGKMTIQATTNVITEVKDQVKPFWDNFSTDSFYTKTGTVKLRCFFFLLDLPIAILTCDVSTFFLKI